MSLCDLRIHSTYRCHILATFIWQNSPACTTCIIVARTTSRVIIADDVKMMLRSRVSENKLFLILIELEADTLRTLRLEYGSTRIINRRHHEVQVEAKYLIANHLVENSSNSWRESRYSSFCRLTLPNHTLLKVRNFRVCGSKRSTVCMLRVR